MFSIIQKLPEKIIPHWLMEWLYRYTTKRINKLKQQQIKRFGEICTCKKLLKKFPIGSRILNKLKKHHLKNNISSVGASHTFNILFPTNQFLEKKNYYALTTASHFNALRLSLSFSASIPAVL